MPAFLIKSSGLPSLTMVFVNHLYPAASFKFYSRRFYFISRLCLVSIPGRDLRRRTVISWALGGCKNM